MSEFLTVDELVNRWKGTVKASTLANWRSVGHGPKPTKPGKEVLYALADVLIYEKSRGIK